MRRLLPFAAIALSALFAATPAGAAGGHGCRNARISSYATATHIRAVHVGCRKARRLASHYDKWHTAKHHTHIDGFSCRRKFKGYEAARVKCRRGRRVVRYTAVAYA